jgi:metal-responsive CopG/Arc/MetJ family transcriptional regulator
MAKNRINISIEDVTLERIDSFAELNGISRSGAISVMVNQCISNLNVLESLGTIASEIKRQSMEVTEKDERAED